MGRPAGATALYLPKGGTVYWCRFTVHGVQHRLSTGERDEGRARARAEELRAEVTLGRKPERYKAPPASARRGSLEDLVTAYLAHVAAKNRAKRYVKSQLYHLNAQFIPRWKSALEITRGAIESFVVERSRQVGSVTLAKELTTLSMFLKWCRANGYILELPSLERVKPVSDYVPTDLTRPQVEALLAALPDRRIHSHRRPVREFYTVLWGLALRYTEACRMRWNWFSFRRARGCPYGTVVLPAIYNKNSKPWTLPLPREVAEVLKAMQRELDPLPTSLVFGNVRYHPPLAAAAVRLELPHVTPHHLRHARLTEIGNSSRDVASIQHYGRHKTLAMTQRYVRTRLEGAAEAMLEADRKARAAARSSKGRAVPAKKRASSPIVSTEAQSAPGRTAGANH